MTISRIRKEDCGKLAALHGRAFSKGWSAMELARLVSEPGMAALASNAPDPDGFILVRVMMDEAEILTLATDPDHRRAGIGRALLTQALMDCARSGAKRVLLEVSRSNVIAIQLYASSGFRETGIRKAYYADGNDALVMEKALGE